MILETKQDILLLYHYPIVRNASTIMEHVNSFRTYSRFRVWAINTDLGFPAGLEKYKFQVIILHYSLFPYNKGQFDSRFMRYLEDSKQSYKIAFFQDEHHNCQRRFDILNKYNIDCIYTLLAPQYWKDVYQKYTGVSKLVHTLTGYVSDDLIKKAERYSKPDKDRIIDIGYRGRELKFYMGKGSQEKREIATRFLEHTNGLGLNIDIETGEGKRFYGDKWYKFLGDCKACLGVEAGVSIFDIDNVVQKEYERLYSKNPNIKYEDMSELLCRYEENIPYRTISPRHFEASAFRICQILYEGEYQGILKPMTHYIPLKKDFSNFDDVIRMVRDKDLCRQLTDNCYQDLIASGKYSFRKFVEDFDQELLSVGFTPIGIAQKNLLPLYLNPRNILKQLYRIAGIPLYAQYRGKDTLFFLGRPLKKMYLRIRGLN